MKIQIYSSLGRDLRTRSFFRRDIEHLIKNVSSKITLDFTEVEFISRSVADEIFNVLCDHPNVVLSGMTGDVDMMYSVVEKSRNNPRVFPSDDNINVVQLNTLKDLDNYFQYF